MSSVHKHDDFSKSQYRDVLLKQLATISHEARASLEKSLFQHLAEFMKNRSGRWIGYQPLKSEPQISWAHLNSEIDWCYPRVDGAQLQFLTRVTEWKKSAMKVSEPQDGEVVALSQITGACIPGVGFHAGGQRLGRGAGFFDRTLAGFKGLKVGLCFDFCYKSDVPVEGHDLQMDYVITDKQIVKLVGR